MEHNYVYKIDNTSQTIRIHTTTLKRLRMVDTETTDTNRIAFLLAFYNKHKGGEEHV